MRKRHVSRRRQRLRLGRRRRRIRSAKLRIALTGRELLAEVAAIRTVDAGSRVYPVLPTRSLSIDVRSASELEGDLGHPRHDLEGGPAEHVAPYVEPGSRPRRRRAIPGIEEGRYLL